MNKDIINHLELLKNRIDNACKACNRDPKEVKVLLATKTVTAQKIKIALQAGFTLIAENKVQELKSKHADLNDIVHTNHFIGYLQTNKIKDILKYNVSCIHSLDRFELAEKLHKRLLFENKTMDVLIQVNTSAEPSKYGIHPESVIEFVQQVAEFDTLKIKGLMTIGLFSTETHLVQKCFQLLQQLQKDIQSLNIPNVEMKELSMGMSNDLEIAIAHGATIIRVGTAIFGPRAYPDSYYWG